MQNITVSDCRGQITGSQNGNIPGNYDHNENLTFTVCVPGAERVEVFFSLFCTEAGYDSLRVFDGPDTLAPQLGATYSGFSPPPSIKSTGNCITLHFRSDENISCVGWIARWQAVMEPPSFPEVDLQGVSPKCSTQTMVVRMTRPVHCDSIDAENFQLTGALNNTVTQALPVNCQGDSTEEIQLIFSPGLNKSGLYGVTYTSELPDQCDSLWSVSSIDRFFISDCPMQVEAQTWTDTICEGECAELLASGSGGDPNSYQYTWSQGIGNGAGPIKVCPSQTQVYEVTLTDGIGSPPAKAQVRIVVLPPPTMPPPDTVCQSEPDFSLLASPPGGVWQGAGIADENGIFSAEAAGPGTHLISYKLPAGCEASTSITVKGVDAGPEQAACPGSDTMLLTFQTPTGGYWTGNHIRASGAFLPPSVVGTYPVYYHANGCVDSTLIHVDTLQIWPLDSACLSDPPYTLKALPEGGYWTGPGITDSLKGNWAPAVSGRGDHILTYHINGCSTSFKVFVKPLLVGANVLVCPKGSPFVLSPSFPSHGTWSGVGILDAQTGLYDPGVMGGDFTDTLVYEVNGCQKKRIVWVRDARIRPDTIKLCLADPVLGLNEANTHRSPWNGTWNGPGVIDTITDGQFSPQVASIGFHKVFYEANGCSDSVTMAVYPNKTTYDTVVCEGVLPFSMRASVSGGWWEGPGIIDSSGIFDASVIGVGQHKVFFHNPFGCLDTASVEVYDLIEPYIENLLGSYCYTDSMFKLDATPPGGRFYGDGVIGDFFNPVLAGPGLKNVYYTYGSGDCKRTVNQPVAVNSPLRIDLKFQADTICFGDFTTLGAYGKGGPIGDFQYTWSHGLPNQPEQVVSPARDTFYSVSVSDGCSDPVSTRINVKVHREFKLSFTQSDTICYGENGFAAIEVDGPSFYQFTWDTDPQQYGDTLRAPTFFRYEVEVKDMRTGCLQVAETSIPGREYLLASFLPNPNRECLPLENATFHFIDLSEGALRGIWDFGDGEYEPYEQGVHPAHTYKQLGEYQVKLWVENEWGCRDSMAANVCVLPGPSGVEVPTAFSPNGDGVNDFFEVKSSGVVTFNLRIFDRWGRIIFQANDPNASWDGTFQGRRVPEGAYVVYIRGSIREENEFTNHSPVKFMKRETLLIIR
ncbi:MAG: gliding motility-associated C-terminal domain-containing protein [Bacteroidota bacterium]